MKPDTASERALIFPEVAKVTPTAVAADFESPLTRLIGRLEALEVRLQRLEFDRKNDAVSVLQEMLEKERVRASSMLSTINVLRRPAGYAGNKESSGIPICSAEQFPDCLSTEKSVHS